MCAPTPGTCFSSLGADRMPGQRQNRYEYPTNPALLQACLLLSLREQWRSDRFVPLHVCLTFIKYAYQCYVCRSFYYCLDYDVSRVELAVGRENAADDKWLLLPNYKYLLRLLLFIMNELFTKSEKRSA